MEIKLRNEILKEFGLAMPWYNEEFLESVLNEIIKNPKITKEELAFKKVKGKDRKKPTEIANEYVAQKFIDIVRKSA